MQRTFWDSLRTTALVAEDGRRREFVIYGGVWCLFFSDASPLHILSEISWGLGNIEDAARSNGQRSLLTSEPVSLFQSEGG